MAAAFILVEVDYPDDFPPHELRKVRVSRQPGYWIQEAQGSDPGDAANRWSTVRVVFDDRVDAEASVERVQAKHPVRYRWPLGNFRLPEVPPPGRNEAAPLWWMRWWLEGAPLAREEWERIPEFQSIDFAELPEACLVPVHVVYRVVAEQDCREDLWGSEEDDDENGRFGFFARRYAPGKRMTEREIDARFSSCFPFDP